MARKLDCMAVRTTSKSARRCLLAYLRASPLRRTAWSTTSFESDKFVSINEDDMRDTASKAAHVAALSLGDANSSARGSFLMAVETSKSWSQSSFEAY